MDFSINNYGRYEELDSLRGIAALSVLVYHSLNVFLNGWGTISSGFWHYVFKSPLKFMWGGHQAVILFFLLSGFVLSLPYFRAKELSYTDFIMKRFCRIYIPYIVAIILAITVRVLFGNGEIAGVWGGKIDWKLIINHILLIGTFNQNEFDPVVWSLVHEMRISLIFPFILVMITKFNFKINLIIGFGFSLMGITLHYLLQNNIDPLTNFFDTFHYMFMFMIGALLAKHMKTISEFFKGLNPFKKIMILGVGLILYAYADYLSRSLVLHYIADWVIGFGGSIFIVSALNVEFFKQMLLKKPVLYLGKVSYSLYLYHLIVFLCIFSLLNNILPTGLLFILSVCLTFLITHLSYKFIELPSIKLGKKLVAKNILKKTA